ncbi:glycosyltransferase family 61 protein [Methylobacterium crusticola]|nr:glycosyltransferase family 61 protein [Methylobacterium crusticola]
MPYAPKRAWGLFDASGHPIRSAVDFRAPNVCTYDQLLEVGFASDLVAYEAAAGTYIYGGTINLHFGHFLINTLPRFWNISRIRTPNTRILCHSSSAPDVWFNFPFISRAFALLGLTKRDFVVLDRPTRLRNVVVAGTSLEEQQAGYRAYGRFGREIGSRIYKPDDVDQNTVPIYYSKSRLRSSVGIITNEAEIEDVLRDQGVDIIHPETLSLDEQVRLMSSRTSIMGSTGSFFHTSIFCPPRRITCLNVTSQINSNYVIIDALAANAATYHYPDSMQVLDQMDGYLTARFLPNAADVALELFDLARSKS